MLILRPILGALLALSATGPASTADAAAQASAFGEPLIINGKRISDNEIKRFLIYTVGRNQVAYRKMELIVDDEIRQRAWYATLDEEASLQAEREAAGQEPLSEEQLQEWRVKRYQETHRELMAKYEPPETAVQKEFDRLIQQFQKRYPILNLEAEISRAFQSVPEFRRSLYLFLYFDRVFLPQDPDEWPPITVEAFRADPAGGDILLDDAKTSYQRRKEWQQENELEDLPPDDDMLKQIHRQIVRDAVYKLVEFRTAADGLPDDMVLWADTNADGAAELELTTEELWSEIEPLVSPTDIVRAKRYWAVSTATRDRMAAEGILLSREECDRAFREYSQDYEDESFSIEVAAQQESGFPSVETYKDYYCMLEGFTRHMEPKLQPDENGEPAAELQKHRGYTQKLYGLAQVDVEVLFVSAFDIPNNRWKEGGWEWARAKADEIVAQIDQHQEDYASQRQRELLAEAKGTPLSPEVRVPEPHVFWSRMMDEHSEWWDPPAPAEGKPPSDIGAKKLGRWGPKYRPDLLGFMNEMPFDELLWGGLVTDFIFFEQDVNTVAGPFCAPRGYYITKVVRRTNPTRTLSLSEPNQLARIKEDYLRVAFRDYAAEALAKADVQGVPEICGAD